ncbi:MAG: SHOCT domain-containing protein [Chitinophagales bacterium]|nr:SHOCT domain-containing protein [Chitinophagales bacterium]
MNAKELKEKGIYIGRDLLFPEKSVQAIINSLTGSETILIATNCNAIGASGVVAVTNKRVIFSSAILFSSKFVDMDINKITSVGASDSIMNKLMNSDKLLIRDSGGTTLELSAIHRDGMQQVVNKIKEVQNALNTSAPASSGTSTAINDLEKLAELKAKGILTEEEFAAKKKQLLGL